MPHFNIDASSARPALPPRSRMIMLLMTTMPARKNGTAFIAMEFIDGVSLEERMQREPLTTRRCHLFLLLTNPFPRPIVFPHDNLSPSWVTASVKSIGGVMSIRMQHFICVTFLLLSGATAAADTIVYDGVNYAFQIDNVPDMDQRRSPSRDGVVKGLPNGGNMYCVPTSAVNLLAYVANHGFPNVGPGPGNWEVSPPANLAGYNFMTGTIFLVGFSMGTNPTKGTGSSKKTVELQLETAYPGQFIVVEVFANQNWSPRARDASRWAIWGAAVNVGMGWYTNADEDQAHMRVGGHVVTLAEGVDDGNTRTLGLNDPARPDDGMITTQSAFVADQTDFHPQTQYFCGQDANGFPAGCYERTQDRLSFTGSGYLDGYLAIFPKYGFTADLGDLVILKPIHFSNRRENTVQRIRPAVAGRIVDLARNPVRLEHTYLVENSDEVWALDVLSGQSRKFAKVKSPLRLTWGGVNETLYVLKHEQLQSFDAKGRRTGNIGLQRPLDAIAFDEKNKQMVGYSRAGGKLYRFDSSLKRESSITIPAEVLGSRGRLGVAVDPDSGEIWSVSEDSRFLHRISISERGGPVVSRILLPEEVIAPTAIQLSAGDIFISASGKVLPLDASGAVRRSSPFYGLPAGASLQIARPFTNFDPTTMIGPAFENVLPEDGDIRE